MTDTSEYPGRVGCFERAWGKTLSGTCEPKSETRILKSKTPKQENSNRRDPKASAKLEGSWVVSSSALRPLNGVKK